MTHEQNSTADELAKWLVTLRSGTATREDYTNFLAWRSANSDNERTWREHEKSLQGQSKFKRLLQGRLSDAYPEVYSLSDTPTTALHPNSPPLRTPTQTRRRMLAGALGLGAAGFCAAYIGNAFYPLRNITADAATATGQRRRYRLSDGSQLLLDARSQANIEFSSTQREISLLHGALAVNIATDIRRPFIVHTRQGVIRAAQAHFMVRQQAQRSLVAVHDEYIQIETLDGAKEYVSSGRGVRFDAHQIGTPRAELIAEASWEHGNINAHGRPLMDIIAALRPYRVGPLRVSAAAGGLPAFGHYSLDDTDATLSALQQRMPISIHYYGPFGVSIGVLPASIKARTRSA